MKKGLSLVEVVVAIGVLAMSVLALMGVLTGIFKLSAQTDESAVAMRGAQELLDRLRTDSMELPSLAVSFDGAANEPKLQGFPPDPYPKQQIEGQEFAYRVEWEPVPGKVDLYLVHIGVHWGKNHQVKLDSYVFRP